MRFSNDCMFFIFLKSFISIRILVFYFYLQYCKTFFPTL